MTPRVTSLDQLNLAFADRFNARDLDGLMALNTADVAVFDEEHGWRYAVDNPFGTV